MFIFERWIIKRKTWAHFENYSNLINSILLLLILDKKWSSLSKWYSFYPKFAETKTYTFLCHSSNEIYVFLANSKRRRSFQWNTVIFQIKFHELQKIKMDCKMSIWNVYPKINVTLFQYWYAKCSATRPVIGVIQCSFRNYQCWICVFGENLFISRISTLHFKWLILLKNLGNFNA